MKKEPHLQLEKTPIGQGCNSLRVNEGFQANSRVIISAFDLHLLTKLTRPAHMETAVLPEGELREG